MKLTFEGVLAEARVLWRAQGDLLLRVAAVFAFLPLLASALFLTPLPADATDQQTIAWMSNDGLELLGYSLIDFYASLAMMVLLIDPGPANVGRALLRALLLFPLAMVAILASSALVLVGLIPLLVPGIYIAGRTFLTLPAIVAGTSPNPFQAVVDSINRTSGNGWLFALITIATFCIGFFGASVLGGLASLIGGPSDVLKPVFGLLSSALGTAAAIAMALLQAAAYRLLTAKQGT